MTANSVPRLSPSQRRAIRRAVSDWYAQHARRLPWREDPTPYRVWVCEIMAQQTRIETVLPYFERFLARFPGVHDLAAATEDEVLALWSGLGYYRRARHLHRAARVVVDEYGGAIPADPHELQRLPGIGRYTAGAIASIAFDRAAPILDGNVARLLARVFAISKVLSTGEARKELWVLADELVPEEHPGAFNQGMMELGALVCTATSPGCPACPLRPHCLAQAQGLVEVIPVKGKAAAPLPVYFAAAALRREGRVLLVRNPGDGLFGGLWMLPQVEVRKSWPAHRQREQLRTHLRDRFAIDMIAGDLLGRIEHTLSHRLLYTRFYACEIPFKGVLPISNGARWVQPSAPNRHLGLAAYTRKFLRFLVEE
ncbi:MAG: A/G-specific adenine glycosylase [Candidatus Lernaella stagnicola]|nr:A/G-specific adenine glycosylase [Candidatus Lernaella stagnicola]